MGICVLLQTWSSRWVFVLIHDDSQSVDFCTSQGPQQWHYQDYISG